MVRLDLSLAQISQIRQRLPQPAQGQQIQQRQKGQTRPQM